MALIARARVYGESVACSGPVYRTYRIEGDKIRIRFDEAEGLAVRDGRVLRGFAVAGADRRFHWAEAAIDGCDVVVGARPRSRILWPFATAGTTIRTAI